MKISEYTIKNNDFKKTEITLSNYNIVNDALKEYIYNNFKGSYLKLKFYGEINNDFRALIIIAEAKNDEDIERIDILKYDEKFNFGIYDIKNDVKNTKNCTFLKLNQNDILHKILLYISYERFEGGYFAKGKFDGQNIEDLEFVGICGDINNQEKIKALDLDKIRSSIPKLTSENDFYINKFISLSNFV